MKNIILIVVLLVCAGGWFYLNYLTKQEQLSARQMRQAMQQAKAKLNHHQE